MTNDLEDRLKSYLDAIEEERQSGATLRTIQSSIHDLTEKVTHHEIHDVERFSDLKNSVAGHERTIAAVWKIGLMVIAAVVAAMVKLVIH